MSAEVVKEEDREVQSNPMYGCVIMILMMSIMGGIVSWIMYSGLKQNAEIDKFTVDVADPLPMAEVGDVEREVLQRKLADFLVASGGGEVVRLTLSVQEMNALVVLAAEAGIADYRGMVRFTGVDVEGEVLLADLCWPMNRLSLKDKSKRYLVGQASFSPYIENGSMDLRIVGLKVPGMEVNEGFLRSLGNWPWLNLAKLNVSVAEVMKRVVRFGFDAEEGWFILEARGVAENGGEES